MDLSNANLRSLALTTHNGQVSDCDLLDRLSNSGAIINDNTQMRARGNEFSCQSASIQGVIIAAPILLVFVAFIIAYLYYRNYNKPENKLARLCKRMEAKFNKLLELSCDYDVQTVKEFLKKSDENLPRLPFEMWTMILNYHYYNLLQTPDLEEDVAFKIKWLSRAQQSASRYHFLAKQDLSVIEMELDTGEDAQDDTPLLALANN